MTGVLTHKLKSWPCYFEAVASGKKTFEIRNNDRNFDTGQFIELQEWDPDTQNYTGRTLTRRIRYMGGGFGVPPGVVVLGIEEVPITGSITLDGTMRPGPVHFGVKVEISDETESTKGTSPAENTKETSALSIALVENPIRSVLRISKAGEITTSADATVDELRRVINTLAAHYYKTVMAPRI